VIEFDAVYYDGKTSTRRPVRAQTRRGGLHVVGADVDLDVPLDQITVDAPIGNTRRTLSLAGGAQLQTDDHAALAALFPRANRLQTWVQALEQRWGYALAALVLSAGFTAWCLTYGLPIAAKVAAGFVPVAIEAKLGEQSLYAFDHGICSPSALAVEGKQALQKSFNTLTAGLNDGYAYRLEFRACGRIGPNAFALPGGAIVMTDELVKLAQNDQQIAAVLAHEIGHVRYRHGLRMGLQAAGVAALIAALAGDAVSITSLAATLPTVLLQSGYSRDFEFEADTYAFQRLKQIGSSPKYFAEMMTLLEDYHTRKTGAPRDGGKGGKAARGVSDYLSTHPDTAKRIERALANQ
jgi:Zn-dependent protease with chaperone function